MGRFQISNNLEPYINEAIKNYEQNPNNKFTLYGWREVKKNDLILIKNTELE